MMRTNKVRETRAVRIVNDLNQREGEKRTTLKRGKEGRIERRIQNWKMKQRESKSKSKTTTNDEIYVSSPALSSS